MKILTVCQYYYPENFQITPILEQLAENGAEVTVLTGLPNYPLGVVPEEYKKGHRDEVINGVHVIRCTEFGRKKGMLHLALNYFSYWFFASRKIMKLKENYDLVFVYQLSPVFMGLPGVKYAKKKKLPLFILVCDIWPESLKMYIQNENSFIFRKVRQISKKIYDAADRLAGQSISFLSYLKDTHSIPEEKLTYIPAFADESYLSMDFEEENGVTDFVFLGNLGIAQDLQNVLEAINQIKDVPGFKVHFVGDGSMLEDMKKYVRENDLEEIVIFHGRRPVEEMTKYYRLADACLVSLKADNQTGYTLPTKVQGYMAAGKPVIGMIDGSAKIVIEESHCGGCVSAGDTKGLAALMKDFIENKEKYSGCGEAGRAYFKENFSKEKCILKLEDEFERLTRKNA